MKTACLIALLAGLQFASAASPERDSVLKAAHSNAKRLAEFQKLSAHAAAAQKEVEAFAAEWTAACNGGQPRADGGCQAPAPPAMPAQPTKRVPPKPEDKQEAPK